MFFEIKSWLNDDVLFSFETKSLKLALEAAAKRGAKLQCADLQCANLQYAKLQCANLQYANLHGADLQCADLQCANLHGADLQCADLQCANLQYANLHGANLRYANLQGADLQCADLHGADLQRAKNLKKSTIQILGHKHPMWTTQEGDLQIGCHVHTFEEWAEKAESLGAENGYSALDVEIYKLHIAHIWRVSQLLWNKKGE